jgi:isoquinoline 1-oxidoreductase beta subunit
MRGTELPTYDIPDRLAEGLQQPTGIRTAPLRAIGVGQNSFANEVFVDEVAHAVGADPLAFRIRQLADTPLGRRGRHVLEEVGRMSDWSRKRQARGLGVAYLDYSGTQLAGVAEVSLDSSGTVRVHHFWCAIDCGVAVQPDNIIAQTESSIVYGLGLALTEHIDVENGLVQQANFFDYQVPRMRDVPEIHIRLVQTAHHPTGAGQMATPLVPSAVSNALFQLTGVRLRQQPLLPQRVRQAMTDAGVRLA